MSTYVYCRVSKSPTSGGTESGDSLATQEATCMEYAARNTIAIDRVFLDPDISARRKRFATRPAGYQLSAILKPGDSVIAYRLDRVFRDVIDGLSTLRDWRQRGIVLHSAVTGSIFDVGKPDGWLAVTMQLVYAEYEPFVTAYRTSQAMRHYQRNGRAMGSRPPYGKEIRANGSLAPCHSEIAIIMSAEEMSRDGLSAGEIAEMLNSMLRTRRNGDPWSAKSVRRLLLRHARE